MTKPSPPQSQARGSAELHRSAAGLPDTATILATSRQEISAAAMDFGSLPNQNHRGPLRREQAGCRWPGMERALLQGLNARLVKDSTLTCESGQCFSTQYAPISEWQCVGPWDTQQSPAV